MGSARSTFLDNRTGECEVVWRQPYQRRQSAGVQSRPRRNIHLRLGQRSREGVADSGIFT